MRQLSLRQHKTAQDARLVLQGCLNETARQLGKIGQVAHSDRQKSIFRECFLDPFMGSCGGEGAKPDANPRVLVLNLLHRGADQLPTAGR